MYSDGLTKIFTMLSVAPENHSNTGELSHGADSNVASVC